MRIAQSLLSALTIGVLYPLSALSATSSPIVVFFDYGSVELDGRARAILDSAVVRWRSISVEASMLVEGHADRAGTPEANQRLSCRRAAAVQAYIAS